MADFSSFKPILGEINYPTKYDNLIDQVESYATEVETAREFDTSGATSLEQNLQENYVKYNLTKNIDGGNIYGIAGSGSENIQLFDTIITFESYMEGATILQRSTGDTAVIDTVVSIDQLTIAEPTNLDWGVGDEYVIFTGYRCENMPDGVNSQDYVTKRQLDAFSPEAPPSFITELRIPDPPAGEGDDYYRNAMLVVGEDGQNLTTRPTKYELKTGTFTCEYNGNYNVNVSAGSASTTLPTGVNGGIISFADIGGHISNSNTLTITPDGTEIIMGQDPGESLIINDYPHISFKLVYVNSTFGWTITEMQR